MGTASAAGLAAVPLAEIVPWSPAGSGGGLTGTLAALLLAAAALFLPGLALAALLPAPDRSPLEFRLAVAPLLSVVIAGVGVRLLTWLSISLHAGQLAVVTLALWALVWWRRRRVQPPDLATPPSRTDLVGLAVQLGLGAVLWVATLVQSGLALPNRDFKNHAVFVAQIAASNSLDPAVVLRDSPAAAESSGVFYPLGLHALLAWCLPSRTGSTVGLTAAATVLVIVVCLPLAVRTLCRLWCPGDARMPWIAGLCSVCLPGATAAAFAIGSVVLLAGTALYAAGLCSLWMWLRSPRPGSALLLGLTLVGLFWLHVAEAVGLVLVACGLPLLSEGRAVLRSRPRALLVAGVTSVIGLGAAAFLWDDLTRLLRLRTLDWDLQPNDWGPVGALLETMLQQPVPLTLLCVVWWALAVAGLLVGRRRGWSGYPAWALTVPIVLSLLSLMSLPALLTAVTAPWYGTATRTMLLAFPVLVVAAAAGMLATLDRARSGALRAAVLAVGLLVVLASTADLVPDRRKDLAASLAGGGNTQAVADWLSGQLRGGGTVLNLEADGTPLLFADARVPVLSSAGPAVVDQPVDGVPLSQRMLELRDPAVARRLAALDVRFIALGTANRYWGQSVGYDWRAVADQPEVQVVAQGDQVVVLRYQADAS